MSTNSDRTRTNEKQNASQETLYACRITILRATSVPVADLHDLSCDPYVKATLSVEHGPSPEDIQVLIYRTHTVRRTLDPTYNSHWIVSGIPASGFLLSLELRDEDPRNYDDALGKAVLRIPWPDEERNKLCEGWKSGDREYKVKKRKGSILPHMFTCFANMATRGDVGHRVRVWVKAEVLGEAADQSDRRLFTIGPRRYVRHFSPFLGRFLGNTNSPDDPENSQVEESSSSRMKPSAFVANRLQLAGPVPEPLRHRYVGFAPFVKAMFRRSGIRGILLHHALHKQHMMIYRWDNNTVWGCIGDEEGTNLVKGHNADVEKRSETEGPQGEKAESAKEPQAPEEPSTDEDSVSFAKQFLRMTSHGTRGRVFTYVMMLDGEWRFTETGDQFTIQFLSKHTMHSDIAVEVAYSGEFFVRPLRHRHTHPHGAQPIPTQDGHPTEEPHPDEEHYVPEEAATSSDPAHYELVIDNDSGTYRPRADLLPVLHAYLARPENLGALGRISCLNAFDDKLKKWKDARREVKERKEGRTQVGRQLSVSSASSAGSSASSASGAGEGGSGDDGDGDGDGKVTKEDVRKAVEEDAKRAKENDDQDTDAKREEQQQQQDTDTNREEQHQEQDSANQ